MKRLKQTVLVLLLAALGANPAWAQHQHNNDTPTPDDKMQGGMMQGGMMQGGMMQNPLHKAMMQVRMLPMMREALQLTDAEVEALVKVQADYQAQQRAQRPAWEAKDNALKALLDQADPDPEQVEQALIEVGTLQARQHAATVTAAATMRALLTPEQRTQLAAMKPEQMHQQMMANMSKEEMMTMMSPM